MITICDTGPLVAYLASGDALHKWAVEAMRHLRGPLLTCEPVLTETAYFLRSDKLDVEPLFELLARGALKLSFDMAASWPRVRTLMGRYERMDLADAAIVAMSEQHRRCQVLTIDRADFTIYRRNDRNVIPCVMPPIR